MKRYETISNNIKQYLTIYDNIYQYFKRVIAYCNCTWPSHLQHLIPAKRVNETVVATGTEHDCTLVHYIRMAWSNAICYDPFMEKFNKLNYCIWPSHLYCTSVQSCPVPAATSVSLTHLAGIKCWRWLGN